MRLLLRIVVLRQPMVRSWRMFLWIMELLTQISEQWRSLGRRKTLELEFLEQELKRVLKGEENMNLEKKETENDMVEMPDEVKRRRWRERWWMGRLAEEIRTGRVTL